MTACYNDSIGWDEIKRLEAGPTFDGGCFVAKAARKKLLSAGSFKFPHRPLRSSPFRSPLGYYTQHLRYGRDRALHSRRSVGAETSSL